MHAKALLAEVLLALGLDEVELFLLQLLLAPTLGLEESGSLADGLAVVVGLAMHLGLQLLHHLIAEVLHMLALRVVMHMLVLCVVAEQADNVVVWLVDSAKVLFAEVLFALELDEASGFGVVVKLLLLQLLLALVLRLEEG